MIGMVASKAAMAKKGPKRVHSGGGGHGEVISITITVIVAFFGILIIFLFYQQQQNIMTSSFTILPSSPPLTTSTTPLTIQSNSLSMNPLHNIPTYHEYITLSQQNHWTPPHDPILKILEISKRYSQLFEINNRTRTFEFFQLNNQELDFLLKVLRKSSEEEKGKGKEKEETEERIKDIDLTEVLFESLEGVHRALFHIEKQILQNYNER
jgi:hypothetical protein